MAGLFKDGSGNPIDATNNAEYCFNQLGGGILSYLMEPVNYMLKILEGLMGDVTETVDDIRGFIYKIISTIQGFMGSVMARLAGTMSEFMVLLTRVRDIMARLAGTGAITAAVISTIFSMAESMFSFLLNLVKSAITIVFAMAIMLAFVFPEMLAFAIPLGAMLGITYSCFDEDTLIETITGSRVPIKQLEIGTITKGGHKILGTLKFEQGGNPMYSIYGTLVSGTHKVYDETVGRWVYVRDHNAAKVVPNYSPYKPLYCVITDTNRIEINDTIFSDYEEISEEKDCREVEKIVWGREYGEDYNTGLAGTVEVLLSLNRKRRVKELQLGDILSNGSILTGLVKVDASDIDWYSVNGKLMSGTTWVLHNSAWTMVRNIPGQAKLKFKHPRSSYHIVTSTGSFELVDGTVVRDYLDTHDEMKMTKIDEYCLSILNK